MTAAGPGWRPVPRRYHRSPARRFPWGLLLASALAHELLITLALLSPAASGIAAPSGEPVMVELIRQNTATGGGDKLVTGEGGPGSTAAAPATVSPATAPPATAPVTPAATAPAIRLLGEAGTPPMPIVAAALTAAAAVPMPPDPTPEAGEAPDQAIAMPGGDQGTGQLTGDANVVPATPVSQVRNAPPAYPAEATRRHEQGGVIVRIHVLENGTVNGVFVTSSSGSPRLDTAARAAVARWRFRPARRAGIPIASDMLFRFDFELSQLEALHDPH